MSLFLPPKEIDTTVFARLPESFHKDDGRDWSLVNNKGMETPSFLEGPCFDADGNLLVVDIPHGRIFSIAPDGTFSLVVAYDGEPNGLKVTPDGRLLVADYRNGIIAIDPASGTVTPLVQRRHTERFKGPNDLFLTPDGDIYFTDQGQTGLHDPTGRVYRLSPTGRLDLLLSTVPSPNGIVLDAAGTTLYVAATRGNNVWRAPLMPDGTVSKVGCFVTLMGGVGPDGLAFDAQGNLAVAHAGLGTVWVFSALGEPHYRVRSCTGLMTTNIAFGPDGGLYITESSSGTVLRAELPIDRV